MVMIAVVVILVLIVIGLIFYNVRIHKKIQKFRNLNQKITNLYVVQDFMNAIGETSTVDEKIKKINDILIERYEIKYSTIVVFDGAEYQVKASNVDHKHWEALKSLQDVDMFKDSIESATPKYADTTTSPAGSVIPGKTQCRKDLSKIMVGHHIPYVAQTIAYMNFKDLYEKAEKAIYTEGPAFLNVLSPCPRGWGYPTEDLMKINKLAVETCYWPLYEVVNGVYHISYKPAKKLPIEEFLKPQKRFRHMFKPGNEWMIEDFQRIVDERWQELLNLEEITNRD